jgi:hypothetical protein
MIGNGRSGISAKWLSIAQTEENNMQQKLRNKFKSGAEAWNWKGGRMTKLGYVFILAKWHYFSDGHGYV